MLTFASDDDASDVTTVFAEFLNDDFEFGEDLPGDRVELFGAVDADDSNFTIVDELNFDFCSAH